jgi:hypothetical protein
MNFGLACRPSFSREIFMPLLTLKVLTSLLQMHSPDATLASDNQGVNTLLGAVREQLAEEAGAVDAVSDPDAVEAVFVPTRDRDGGGGGRGGRSDYSRIESGPGGGDKGRAKDFSGPGGGNKGSGGGGGATARTKPKEPKPFARTIFRKGEYGKSVYGPQHKRIDL